MSDGGHMDGIILPIDLGRFAAVSRVSLTQLHPEATCLLLEPQLSNLYKLDVTTTGPMNLWERRLGDNTVDAWQ